MSTVRQIVVTTDGTVEMPRVESYILESLCFVEVHHTRDWSVRLWVPKKERDSWLGFGPTRIGNCGGRQRTKWGYTVSGVWDRLVKDGQLLEGESLDIELGVINGEVRPTT